jgi:hypothetical protein
MIAFLLKRGTICYLKWFFLKERYCRKILRYHLMSLLQYLWIFILICLYLKNGIKENVIYDHYWYLSKLNSPMIPLEETLILASVLTEFFYAPCLGLWGLSIREGNTVVSFYPQFQFLWFQSTKVWEYYMENSRNNSHVLNNFC